jgi:hypothetical protein
MSPAPREGFDTDERPPWEDKGDGSRFRSTVLADVTAERVTWLWRDRLPRGKVVILDGDPAVGKSTLTVDLAARISTGRPMPGEHFACVPASAVVLMAAEDGLADTIRPRLDAAGGDPSKVHHFDAVARVDDEGNTRWQPPTIPDDVAALEALIVQTGAVLVVVDVLMAYLSGRADSHRDQDVRRALAELADVADRTGACIILLRHLRKSRGSAMYAGGGSIGIIGVARVGLVAAADPDDETARKRVLAVVKNNLGPTPPALAYSLTGDEATSVARVDWLGESPHTADALLAPVEQEPRSARDEAADWLLGVIGDGSPTLKQVETWARDAGIARRTLHRVAADIGVVVERDDTKQGRPSTWRLPFVPRLVGTKPLARNMQSADQPEQPPKGGLVPTLGLGTKASDEAPHE